ncbi:hypothetical protein H4R35_005638, partial [Dimargaris xerosporica]
MRYGIALMALVAAAWTQPMQTDVQRTFTAHATPGQFEDEQKSELLSPSSIKTMPLELLVNSLRRLNPMTLKPLKTINRKFYHAVAAALEPEKTVIEAHYLQEPAIPNKVKAEYRCLQQAVPPQVTAHFTRYFWDHLQFRQDYGILLPHWKVDISQILATTIDNLRDDMYILCEQYFSKEHLMTPSPMDAKPSTPTSLSYSGFFTKPPIVPVQDYSQILDQLKESVKFMGFQSFTAVRKGILGEFNDGYMMEIPDLVEGHLKIINTIDLLPTLEKHQNKLIYKIWIENIALKNPARSQHFFNDIMAFQIIPNLIGAYVAKGYYNQVLAFIRTMVTNDYLKRFWRSISSNNGLNYYERAAYWALGTGHEKAMEFVGQMKDMPGFRANRLFQCMSNSHDGAMVAASLKRIFDEKLLEEKLGEGECERFWAQLRRG